ncbi:MAG TPA: stage II sporulation protein R [Firmicutes bacterium]|nr:stage II sporulation protein R [Bacillota bacterium]
MGRVLAVALILAVASAGVLAINPPGREVPPDVLRLHIRANSDAPEDQEVKMAVRDAVLKVLDPGLRQAESAVEACRLVEGQLEEIGEAARQELQRRGKEGRVTVSLGRTHFPARQYRGIAFPAGEYLALQIFLGEGTGSNWWCVLFPPLCLVDGTTARAAGAEGDLVEEGEGSGVTPAIRFKIVEWFQSLTGN